MGLTILSVTIKGKTVSVPRDNRDIEFDVQFDNEAVQANVSTTEFRWLNDAAQLLIDDVEGGKTGETPGIFEGPPMQMCLSDDTNTRMVFDGFMDYSTYEEISSVEVKCSIMKTNGMNSLVQRAEATTYGHLRDIGLFPVNTFTDVPYVIIKKTNILELLFIGLAIFNAIIQLIDAIKRIAEGITYIVKAATPDATTPVVIPNVGQIVSAIVLILIDIFITILIIIALTDLFIQFFDAFLIVERVHKSTRHRKLMEVAAAHFGFKFESDIEDLDIVVYLPTPEAEDTPILVGIPRSSDFGYFVSDMFDLMHRHYHTKIAVIDGTLHLRTVSDPFWRKSSTYKLPSVNDETRKYNTNALFANRVVEFATDLADTNTIDNFKGTIIETITTPKTVINPEMVLIKNLDHVQIPVALATAKEKVDELELALLGMAGLYDSALNSLGGNSSKSKEIKQLIGQMKLSGPIHTVPKSVPIVGGRMPKDARKIFSARTLDEKYHSEKSFVQNNFSRQRRVFEDIRIPFGFSNFLELEKNSFFVTEDGADGKMISFKYKWGQDTAIATYEIDEVYTKNLEETTIEP